MLMLEHKALSYRTVELPTALHPFLLRLVGHGGNPAPFRKIDHRRHRMLANGGSSGHRAGVAGWGRLDCEEPLDCPLP
jgi:hypothetical protein